MRHNDFFKKFVNKHEKIVEHAMNKLEKEFASRNLNIHVKENMKQFIS